MILECAYVKCIIDILFIPCHKNDDGLFLRLHAQDMPCQSHAVQTCAEAVHLYVQKNNVMILTIREVRISRGIFRDTAFPALPFDERNKVRPYIFFIITYCNFYRICHLQYSTNLSEKSG